MKNFRIMQKALPIDKFPLAGNQGKMAEHFGATHACYYNWIGGNARAMPLYIWRDAAEHGYTIVVLGGTTYNHSVLGLVPIPELA